MVERVREKVFRRWCNSILLPTHVCIEDLSLDVKDGVKLCRMVELLSKKSIPDFVKTPSQQEKVRNIDALLEFIKSSEGMVHSTVSKDGILQGDVKATCSLIWSLIVHYQILPLIPEKWTSICQSVRELINSKLLPGNQINNFTSDWMDGTVFAMLAKEKLPSTWNPKELNILEAAEKYLEVPRILFWEELQSPDIDEESVMTYATLLVTKMAHQSSSRHQVVLADSPSNNLFVKVNAGTSILINNDNMKDLATNASSKSESSISIEISIITSSGEIVVESLINDTVTSNVKVEAQYIGSSTTNIDDITTFIFTSIANFVNSSIYVSVTKQFLDNQPSPIPTYGWMNPG